MNPLAFFGSLGPWEVIVIAVIALLLFGKRLPEVARSAGQAVVKFKQGLHEVEDDIEEAGKSDKDKSDKPDKSDKSEAPSKSDDKPAG